MNIGFLWLWCAAWWLMTIFVLRKRHFQHLTLSHQLSAHEVRAIQQRLSVALVMPCVLLQLCEWLGGASFPEGYGRSVVSTNPWMLVAWIVVVLYWLLVGYWVWIHPGADYLARFASVFNLPDNPTKIRWCMTGLIIVSALSSGAFFITH